MFKMREGVPYEASIFFGGDGIKIQEIAEGQVEQVNGREFAGPGVIVREWPLRGVAICPYGADSNTESAAFGNGEVVAAQEWQQPKEEEIEMSTEEQAVEVEAVAEAPAVEAPAVEAEVVPTVETLAAQLSESAESLTAAQAQGVTLTTERDEARTALAAAQAEVAELRTEKEAAEKARMEAESKLAALTAGQAPVSATPAEGINTGTLMERARKAKKS
jgi:hypothetical protein